MLKQVYKSFLTYFDSSHAGNLTVELLTLQASQPKLLAKR